MRLCFEWQEKTGNFQTTAEYRFVFSRIKVNKTDRKLPSMCFLDLQWTKLENLNRLLLQCQKYQLIKLLLKEGPCYGILTKTKKGIVLHLIGFYYI